MQNFFFLRISAVIFARYANSAQHDKQNHLLTAKTSTIVGKERQQRREKAGFGNNKRILYVYTSK